jgi:D-aminopeptidase
MHRIGDDAPAVAEVRTLANNAMNPLFDAVIEAVEEAILNAILASPTMTANGHTAHTLPTDLLLAALEKYGRPASRP